MTDHEHQTEAAGGLSAVDRSVSLLPCPFCGGTHITGPIYMEPDDHGTVRWWIECQTCPCGLGDVDDGVTDPASAWNKRTNAIELTGALKARPNDRRE